MDDIAFALHLAPAVSTWATTGSSWPSSDNGENLYSFFSDVRTSCSRTRSSKLLPSPNGLSSVRTESLAPGFGYRKITTRDSGIESNDSDRRTPGRSLQRLNDRAVTLWNDASSLWHRKRPTETALAGWGGRIRTSAWRNQNPLPYRLATPQCTEGLPLAESHRGGCNIAASP
jgi:hypothetical protein